MERVCVITHPEAAHHVDRLVGGRFDSHLTERGHAQAERTAATHRVIVTRGGTANWVIAAWMRIPLPTCAHISFRMPSGSVTVLERDDRFHNRSLVALGRQDL